MSGTIVAKIRFDNGIYQTFGELPRIGSFAPDFSLVNTKLQDVSLANWMGIRKIMNTFVSIDFDVSAQSVIRFDEYGGGRDDLALLMVSYDLPFAHKRFQESHDLQNVAGLSAIRHSGFGENYGVLIKELRLLARTIFVIDKGGKVRYLQYVEETTSEPDYDKVLIAIREIIG